MPNGFIGVIIICKNRHNLQTNSLNEIYEKKIIIELYIIFLVQLLIIKKVLILNLHQHVLINPTD